MLGAGESHAQGSIESRRVPASGTRSAIAHRGQSICGAPPATLRNMDCDWRGGARHKPSGQAANDAIEHGRMAEKPAQQASPFAPLQQLLGAKIMLQGFEPTTAY